MIQVSRLKFTVRHADGSVQELTVDSDRALVGSGAYAEIRLPRDRAATEVILIENRNGGLVGEVRSFDPAPTLNGTSFTGGRLLPGSVLGVGDAQITIEVERGSATASAGSSPQSKSSPVTTIAAVLLLAGAVGMLLFAPAEAQDPSAPPVPALWPTGRTAERCAQQDSAQAAAAARENLLLAEGRRERAPFFFEDGVAAVSFYEKAAACFEIAGGTAETSEARASAQALQKKLQNDYHVHEVRLERALVTKEYDQARREAKILRSYLQGRKEEYVSWLGVMDRTIELKYSGKKTP